MASFGKSGIIRSGPRSVTSECPVSCLLTSCLQTVPPSGRSPYALHRSLLKVAWPGWPGQWEDRPMAPPSQRPPQPGSAFSWRPNLIPLVFSFTFTPKKHLVKVSQVLPSVSFTFIIFITERRIRRKHEFKRQITCCFQVAGTLQASLLLREGLDLWVQSREHTEQFLLGSQAQLMAALGCRGYCPH